MQLRKQKTWFTPSQTLHCLLTRPCWEWCRGLQHLDMSSNQLQAATCAALGHVLSAGCQLQHLRLDMNPLGKQVQSPYTIE